jgi:AAT family amino acid transporter
MADNRPDSDEVHVMGHDADYDKNIEGANPDAPFVSRAEHPILADRLARKLSARQVQMIAIGGTIGTGLFLGTGKSLYIGGPASMLIAYCIVGGIVMLTMLALGEMAAYVPIAGSFCTFAGRYVDDSLGFALTWNYWFNDAVSTAADLVALQLVFSYWSTNMPGWAMSLIFWVFLIFANIITVRAYGEVSSL